MYFLVNKVCSKCSAGAQWHIASTHLAVSFWTAGAIGGFKGEL